MLYIYQPCPAGDLLITTTQKEWIREGEECEWYQGQLRGLLVLSFLSIVLDFLHDLRLCLRHKIPQRPVGHHRAHKRVLLERERERE
jgi:hypothetical protein